MGQLAQVLDLGLPAGGLEARDQHLAELDLELAALRDLHRGRHRLRPGGERLRHLGAVLEVELVRVEAQLRLGERALRLHAQQRPVVIEVVPPEVVHVGRAHHRPPDLARDPRDVLVRLVLLGDAVALELEVDVLGAEDLDQVVRVRAGVGRRALDQPAAEARLEAARQRDHALRVAREQVHVHVGLAAPVALQVARRAELHQVAEALVAAGEQGQVVALVADRVRLDVVHQVGLDADDRLDPVLAAGLVVLHRAVHHAVVGEAQRGLPERRRALGQRVDAAGAVEHRVLGVNVEVDAPSRGPEYRVGTGPLPGPAPLVADSSQGRRSVRR